MRNLLIILTILFSSVGYSKSYDDCVIQLSKDTGYSYEYMTNMLTQCSLIYMRYSLPEVLNKELYKDTMSIYDQIAVIESLKWCKVATYGIKEYMKNCEAE